MSKNITNDGLFFYLFNFYCLEFISFYTISSSEKISRNIKFASFDDSLTTVPPKNVTLDLCLFRYCIWSALVETVRSLFALISVLNSAVKKRLKDLPYGISPGKRK